MDTIKLEITQSQEKLRELQTFLDKNGFKYYIISED